MTNILNVEVTYANYIDPISGAEALITWFDSDYIYYANVQQAVGLGGVQDLGASPYPMFPTINDAIAYYNDSSALNLVDQINTTIGTTYYTGYIVSNLDPSVSAAISAVVTMIPDSVSDLINDSGFITSSSLVGYETSSHASSTYATKATTVNGKALSSNITLAASDLSLATVASTGVYSDLTGKPSIPTATSQLTNDTGFLTTSAVNSVNGKTGTVVIGQSDISGLATALSGKQSTITTGSTSQYFKGDLSLGTFPTVVSAFTNDASYVTSAGLATSLGSYATTSSLTTGLAGKQNTLTTGTSSQYIKGDLSLGTLPTVTVYSGATVKANPVIYSSSATVASGVAVFNLTNDGTSTGTAIFPNGPITSSLNCFVSDSAASYQMAGIWSNSNKTLTITTNKLTTANILTGLLGQAAANSAVVNVQVWGN